MGSLLAMRLPTSSDTAAIVASAFARGAARPATQQAASDPPGVRILASSQGCAPTQASFHMNHPSDTVPAAAAAVLRAHTLMTPSLVPSISTELLTSADGELNRELHDFLFDPPTNRELLKGKTIAICCTNGVEEVEITGSIRWLTEHGAKVHVVSPRIGEFHPTLGLRFPPLCATHVLAIRLMENAGWLKIDRYLDQANVADYDACIFPGGCWNPDALRADTRAQAFVRGMLEAGKPTCAICHGQWVMVSAGILKGRRATAVWNIHPDLANAGATVLDEPCVVDGNLITARFPYDLPRMIAALVKQLVR
jgi:protease I